MIAKDVRTNIKLDKKLMKELKMIATLRNTTQQDLLKEMASDWINNCEEIEYIRELERKKDEINY